MNARPPAFSATALSDIFARLNMSELPVITQHVQGLIAITHSASTTNADLSKLILKDYSLASRVLQCANSAYYSQGRKCNTISNAVALLGFNAIRDLAHGVGLFEEFLKSGVDKDAVMAIMTRSFLAGFLARDLAVENKIKVEPEEVFLCGLFYNLGKIILCLYLPVSYRDIELKIETGMSEELACREVLAGLTFREIGIEVAKFWNLPDSLLMVLEKGGRSYAHPPLDFSNHYLASLIHFANVFVESLCDGFDLDSLFQQYGVILSVGINETLISIKRSVDEAEITSTLLRSGVTKLKIQTKIRFLMINLRNGLLNSDIPQGQEGVTERTGQRNDTLRAFLSSLQDQEKYRPNKTVHHFIEDLNLLVKKNFSINEFYRLLLEAFHQGMGFDRAVLATVNTFSANVSLVGRLGAGDIDHEGVKLFEQPLDSESNCPMSTAMVSGKDVIIPATKSWSFSRRLQHLVKDRTVYLFPIVIEGKGVSMIYLDRKAEQPLFNNEMIKTVRQLRELAVSAIIKIRAVS